MHILLKIENFIIPIQTEYNIQIGKTLNKIQLRRQKTTEQNQINQFNTQKQINL